MKLTSSLKKAAGMALLTVAATAANATTIDLGPIPVGPTPTTQSIFVASPGPFNDIFTFTMPANGGSGYSVFNFPIPGLVNTALTGVSLFSNFDGILFNADDTVLTSITSNQNKMTLNWGPSAAGSYYLNVTGIANGSMGGAYGVAIGVSPVPEPESYAMMLIGLGLMGAIARRRNKSDAV
jgi:hypothetical protein